MSPERPEPDGWSLLDAINTMREELRTFITGTVTTSTLALVQKAWDDKDQAKGREIGDLRAQLRQLAEEHDTWEKRALDREDDQRRQRGQLWIGLCTVAVSSIATLIITLITHH